MLINHDLVLIDQVIRHGISNYQHIGADVVRVAKNCRQGPVVLNRECKVA